MTTPQSTDSWAWRRILTGCHSLSDEQYCATQRSGATAQFRSNPQERNNYRQMRAFVFSVSRSLWSPSWPLCVLCLLCFLSPSSSFHFKLFSSRIQRQGLLRRSGDRQRHDSSVVEGRLLADLRLFSHRHDDQANDNCETHNHQHRIGRRSALRDEVLGGLSRFLSAAAAGSVLGAGVVTGGPLLREADAAFWDNLSSATIMEKLPGGKTGKLVMSKCPNVFTNCLKDEKCREAMFCNARCESAENKNACNLLCSLTSGYENKPYGNFIQCLADAKALPDLPPDGKCLATDEDALPILKDLKQIEGRWWIVKGLNCGQEGWPAGFDGFPCQRDEFILREDGTWVDEIAYCGGKEDTCTTPMVYTRANATITSPGVMAHYYLDPPLSPQVEQWRLLSWPHPDWMLYIYCGVTPAGEYSGGSVVSRQLSLDKIPKDIEEEFRKVAKKFNFDYDEMCVSDN
eukprot:Cvel_6806.t1-p1 / transcript=Cvel_6806.t1 / gene=Cvel_6806 / organism=Chromera_velia_CCMP2878 / gene_product=Violaxanthin de-epoxidase, chloroplastic, putative / transcript_product=Violaxanthin de-epoxidase, chloroplastic, putative / location=Cvel_scaffold342:91320-97687(+) / protein_length=457 / sequence_SO=supercontig / SO=protein_coding / is_pseudo=false